jgi:phenylacetate-CoA ligase
MGRADQTTKVKGMFIHAEQIEKVRKEFPHITKMRLTVTSVNYNDQMQLECECDKTKMSKNKIDLIMSEISKTLKKVTKLSGQVALVPLESLADDGKVINDLRVIN